MTCDFEKHKQLMLSHCCMLAEHDQAYALSAAEDYERKSHGVLTNLKRKVQQHIHRMNSRPPETKPTQGEPDGI